MNKILIVDGNNLLFQMFYGIPNKVYNKSHETIHATLGFISAILRLNKMLMPTHIIVVFDSDGSIEKEKVFQDYKKNRFVDWENLKDDEIPFNEEEKIIKCLNYLNIKVLKSKNMEADDLIASLTYLFNDDQIYICSNDSDFFQLIKENISIIKYKGKNTKIYGEKEFYEQFDFPPSKYCFYKTLVGDSTDNIDGFTQIGKIRASQLVKNYNSFSEVLLDDKKVLTFKLMDIIQKEKDKYDRNLKIIKLKYHSEVKYSLDEFVFDKNKINESNSMILSINHVFD